MDLNEMADPQTENGYLKIANELFDKLGPLPLSGSEFRILNCIIRKTYGWNKSSDKISLSQFSKWTGLKRSNTVKTIAELVVKRLLVKELNIYKINKNYEEWVVVKRLPPVVKRLLPSSQTTTKTSSQLTTHKRHKDTNTKDTLLLSPKEPPLKAVGRETYSVIITHYQLKFEETVGAKWHCNYPRVCANLKTLLKTFSEQEIIDKITIFFDSKDEFVRKAGYDFGVFLSQINKLTPTKKKGFDPVWDNKL